ncbi:DUF6507 family protein [Zhihengliuella flava]|uniref:Uncharacterized protein n=1 Tax=Zhihengliuella flava TaxID=1285193 RepID=A0A931GFP0_9MICC|nr:DUF6507 family protein [Zhihengliuella flava]MBG6085460.1 hypothetical protein [Zhihengliuella flava]
MALDDYDISPGALGEIKTNVETEHDHIATKRKDLSDEVDECVTSCKMPQVASALTEAWNGLLAIQTEAAETRITNATTALGDVVRAYHNGDQEMMDDATTAINAVPDLEIDDGKSV